MKLVRRSVFLSILFCFSLSLLRAQPKYEFRAVWVATVQNIDWPSKKGLSSEQQKQEFTDLLDMNQLNGMNAVIVQIRPSADAFYPSEYEPWSEYLTGKQGAAPVPYYDPLAFMIEETHKRGMEFHAWLNPYRAVFNIRSSSLSSEHITRKHPEWFINYGDKKYFNPGLPEVMHFVTDVVKDILTRYDVDGIHMDDYFYPYRIAGKEFPDNAAYRKYGNKLDKDAWRRSNCDSIVKMVHEAVLEINPMVKLGISPFGVWRNKSDDIMGSDTRAGQTNYDDLYADILLWLQKGWIDYVVPQLYWEIGHPLCDYEKLLNWWAEHSYGKHVYIGHGIYRAIEKPTRAWRNTNELPDEIKLLRENNYIRGSVYFSSKSLQKNPNGWSDSLRNNYYRTPALIPPMEWIDTVPPQNFIVINLKQVAKGSTGYFVLSGSSGKIKDTQHIKNYVVYLSNSLNYLMQKPALIIPVDTAHEFKMIIPVSLMQPEWEKCYITLSCVDRENNESKSSNILQLIKRNNEWLMVNP